MEKEGFGEEFSICSSFCLGGIRGGLFLKRQILHKQTSLLAKFVYSLCNEFGYPLFDIRIGPCISHVVALDA
jgi:hypothetical protein